MDRFDALSQQYAQRIHGVSDPEAKRIYCRYNLVADILEQVERLDPDDLPEADALTGILLKAAEVSQPSDLTAGDDIEVQAVLDEQELYRSAVRTLPSRAATETAPPGYRRVLTADESSAWRIWLQRRWEVEGGTWHPMLPDPVPPGVLVLTDAGVMRTDGVEVIRRVLHEMGRQRVIELREYGADYLLDIEMFSPQYTGAEGLWTDPRGDWIAHASHEGTVAFGGILADALTTNWPDLHRWRWHGWCDPSTTPRDPT